MTQIATKMVSTPASARDLDLRLGPLAADKPGATQRGGLALARPLQFVAFSALVGGLLLRVLPLLRFPMMPFQTCDGRAYYALGISLAQGKGLVIEDPYTIAACGDNVGLLGQNHHFAPAMAFIEGLFVFFLGDTDLALELPIILLSLAAVLVTWWTTRDLFGSDAALLVAAAVSLEWTGIVFGSWFGYSENLVVISFVLTLWAVLRGLRDERFLVLAGLFAGIGYLAKAGIGWFFLIAGLAGLLWRVAFRGWGILRSRWYWAAIAVFAIPVVGWSYRNTALFWDGTLPGLLHSWQTSEFVARYVAAAFAQPELLIVGLAGKLPILLVGLALPLVPLRSGFAASLRRPVDEEVLGLWLSVGLFCILGWFFAAAFWVTERSNLLWADALRYVMPAQIPLLWLLVRNPQRAVTPKWLASLLILGLLAVAVPLLMFPEGNLLGRT